MRRFFVTLNWNTTELLKRLIETVDATTLIPHTWVIVENGSLDRERRDALRYCADRFAGSFGVFSEDKATWGNPGKGEMDCVVVRSVSNLGCVLGHNLAFDMCSAIADGEPYDIVMMDSDVEVYQEDWLKAVYDHIDSTVNRQGVIGLEHSSAEVCAGAVFLDTSGNWYLHGGQTTRKVPVVAESVGLGMAMLKWPVPKLRFDTGFVLYYKQDDDLCFQVRANLGLDVEAYPIDMIHWGSRALRENDYQVNEDVRGRESFEEVKRKNQKYFAQKWAWALRGRRPTLQAEAVHLEEIAALMLERRLDSGLTS